MRYEVYTCYDFELTGKLEFTNTTGSVSGAMAYAASHISDKLDAHITDANVCVWDRFDGVYLLSMCYTRDSGWFKC